MEHKPALYALMRLHAELGGKIKDNAAEAAKLRASMRHVEAVLHLLEPGFNARTIAARRKRTQALRPIPFAYIPSAYVENGTPCLSSSGPD